MPAKKYRTILMPKLKTSFTMEELDRAFDEVEKEKAAKAQVGKRTAATKSRAGIRPSLSR